MKKLRNIIGIIVLLSVTLFSCSKSDEKTNDQISAQSVISSQFMEPSINPDFSFLISSVNALQLLEDSIVLDPQVVVQGYYKNKIQSGDLKVNTNLIPFDSPSYYLDYSTLDSENILGQSNTISIVGGELLDGFTVNEYCQTEMRFHFEDIQNKNKYDLDEGFKVVWDIDNNNLNGVIVVVISAEDSNGSIINSLELYTENDGQAVITSSNLTQFNTYSSISVFVARGIDKVFDFNNKTFRYTVINYEWARIYKL